MARIHPGGFRVDALEKTNRARLSQKNAEEALLLAAQIIRDGKPLPMGMAEWIADAIESAIKSPEKNAPAAKKDVGQALLVGLGLRNNNRRKAADWLEVGQLVKSLTREGMKKTPAIEEAAARLGIGYGTAQATYAKYCEALEEDSRISRDEV